jgi:ribose 5-phosphate isomerase B
MRIGIGSDHAGFAYKEMLIPELRARGHEVVDFGTSSPEPVDYPTYIRPVALAVAAGECERGIVLGGSGNGEAIVANRVKGVRCALCWNVNATRGHVGGDEELEAGLAELVHHAVTLRLIHVAVQPVR